MEFPEQQPINPLTPVSPPPTLSKPLTPASRGSKKTRFVIGFLLGVIVVGVALSIYVYKRPVTDTVVRAATSVLPYPAAIVNGELVTIKDFLYEYDALTNFFAEQEQKPSEDELAVTVVDTLVNKVVLEQLAASRGVVLDESKVQAMMDEALAEGEEAFAQQLEENFDWTIDDFRERVVKSLVLANQMSEFVSADSSFQAERKVRIEEALNRLANGEEFAVVAGDISEDFSAKAGGDIGYVPLSEMVDPWLSAIANLENNQISGIVESQENFMIFKVTDRIAKEADEEIQMSVILVEKRTLDELVDEFMAESEIKRYLGQLES